MDCHSRLLQLDPLSVKFPSCPQCAKSLFRGLSVQASMRKSYEVLTALLQCTLSSVFDWSNIVLEEMISIWFKSEYQF